MAPGAVDIAARPRLLQSPWTLASALLSVFLALYFGSPGFGGVGATVASMILAAGLIHASVVDLRHHVIPDIDSLGLILVGLAVVWWRHPDDALAHALSSAGWFAALWLLSELYLRWRGIDGFGLGDVKLMAAAGAWLGPEGSLHVMATASVAAILLLSAIRSWRDGDSYAAGLPFGPFLALGIWTFWLYRPLV